MLPNPTDQLSPFHRRNLPRSRGRPLLQLPTPTPRERKIGPELVGKIHIFVGEMDNYYLNLAVYRMEDFFKATKNPFYGGSFVYGRPMKGHGWSPLDNVELVRAMARYIVKHAPKGDDTAEWHYK